MVRNPGVVHERRRCGVAAAPCRVASAGLKMLPLVGHVAAAPTDACAGVIDP
jgi:hypothetical protein